VVVVESSVFWNISQAGSKQTSACYLLHAGFIFFAYSTTLKMEVTCSSNMLGDFQWTTWLSIPEDRTLHILTCFNNIYKKKGVLS
jgi:hypothetical protein